MSASPTITRLLPRTRSCASAAEGWPPPRPSSAPSRGGGIAPPSTVVRPGHIVDPLSGEPVDSPWRTVTVAARTCVTANTASTAAIVLGEDAPAWLAARALPARLVGHDGSVVCLGGWPG